MFLSDVNSIPQNLTHYEEYEKIQSRGMSVPPTLNSLLTELIKSSI